MDSYLAESSALAQTVPSGRPRESAQSSEAEASPAAAEASPAAARAPWRPSQLRAAILLGGTVRTSGFAAAIKRSLLDLPIGGGMTLLSYWGEEFSQLTRRWRLAKLTVRLVIGRNCFAPQKLVNAPGVEFTVERDPVEFRGAGGVLRDLAEEYNDDDLLLVANANQLSSEPLWESAERLLGSGDVRLLAGAHQEPTGLLLLRCGCLRQIAVSGFVDLKEQALPAIAARHSVRVIAGGAAGHSIRRWDDYLAAIRDRHRPPGEPQASAYQEDWQPLFSVVDDGAKVAPTASVHDSVVLAGGRVDAKATLVRSLVGPGGVVRRGEVVVGKLVTAGGQLE